MEKLGTVSGLFGILVCVCATIGRFVGTPRVFRMEASNVLLIGATLLILGCFLKTFKK